MIARRNRRYQLPPIVSHPLDDVWSVIVPIARTNLITNPSFETNTTGYTAGAGTMSRSTEQQYHGTYSLKYVPSAAAFDSLFTTVDLTASTVYAVSCKFRGAANVPYQLLLTTTGAATLTQYDFLGTGRWQWIWMFWNETSTATRRIYVRKNNSTSTAAWYIDGVQAEACETGNYFVTTYIDGDQQGLIPNQVPAPYFWNGTPHASTSGRSGLTRAGGRVIPFKRFQWILIAIIGLGLAPPENQSTEYAVLDGGQDQATRKPTRQFTLTGRFDARSYYALQANVSDLAQLLDRDYVAESQRLKLRYQAMSGCRPIRDEAEVICKYQGGLEGNVDGHFARAAPITFVNYLPYVVSAGEEGVALDVQDSITNANAILQRSSSGVWSAMSTGMSIGVGSPSVLAILRGLDGVLYAGGDYTGAGASGADYLAKWNGSSWAVVKSATSINAQVNALALGPDGRLYVVGNFTNADGIAAADFVTVYDPNANTYAALGTGTNGFTNAAKFAPDGSFYIGGAFTLAGGVANTVRIAKWDGSAWSALSTGANDTVYALAVGLDGSLYAGGDFTTIGGVSASRIAKWNGTAWSALGTGMNGTVFSLLVGSDGTLYAGGSFTTAGGVTANRIAKWNGTSWSTLGTGMNGAVQTLTLAPDRTLYAGGAFTTADGITLPDRFARWNGSAWVFPDVDLPGTSPVTAIYFLPDETLYIGFGDTGTATAAGQATATNNGTGYTYPTLIIKGPSSGTSRIYGITNYTTRRTIYLNLTLSAGETAMMRFEPDNLSFTSDFQGDITGKILPGSHEADFVLQPGANLISILSASSTVTATLQWRPAYVSLDDLP